MTSDKDITKIKRDDSFLRDSHSFTFTDPDMDDRERPKFQST